MIITIDTTQPVSDIDRAILSALLGNRPVGVPTPAHTPRAAPVVPASTFQERLAAAQSAKPRGAMEEARLPVTQQAGVRSTPSEEGSDPYEDTQDAQEAADAHARHIESGRDARPLSYLASELDTDAAPLDDGDDPYA